MGRHSNCRNGRFHTIFFVLSDRVCVSEPCRIDLFNHAFRHLVSHSHDLGHKSFGDDWPVEVGGSSLLFSRGSWVCLVFLSWVAYIAVGRVKAYTGLSRACVGNGLAGNTDAHFCRGRATTEQTERCKMPHHLVYCSTNAS